MPSKDDEKVIVISTGTILKVIIFIALAWTLFILKDVLLIVLMAIVLSSSIEPGVRWFEKRKIPRLLGVVFIYLCVALLFATTLFSLLPVILNDVGEVIKSLPQYVAQVNDFIPLLDESILQGYVPVLLEISKHISSLTVENRQIVTDTNILGTASAIVQHMLNVVMIFVLSFYFSVTKNGVENFLSLVTPIKYESYVINLWTRTREKIGAWMQGQLLLGIVVGFLVYAVLAVFKVEHALILGILAGLFELIPVFGPVLSAIPGVILALFDQGVTVAIIIAFWYIIVQQLENHLLYPAVVKKIVGISPLLVILALIVGGKLGGFFGIILSVPISVLLVEFIDDLEKKKAEIRKQI